MAVAASLPDDTRGIVDPAVMGRYATLRRYPAGEQLSGIVDWFWSVTWHLPEGVSHDQQVLNHPSGHISIGTSDDAGATCDRPAARTYGLISRLSHRHLVGDGWTVAAKTTTGGLGALLRGPARAATDRALSLDDALGVDGDALLARVVAADGVEAQVDLLREALVEVAAAQDPERLARAREVARVAAIAETDRTVTRVGQLAAAARMSVRSLQRLFDEYVGASPAWVIRRWRIIEAAESAKRDPATADWAELAQVLGYSDQAHLVRDFRCHLGTTPAAYLHRQQ